MLQKIAHPSRMVSFSRFTHYFSEVARLGSIRKAAEKLHVSASAIDRQILAAEEEFGVPLFERLPSGMRLTAAGEILVAATREWQKNYGAVLMQISQLQGLKRGHVDIGMIDALADGLVPESISKIATEFSQITFGLQIKDNAEVANMIATGQVDFGLLLGPVSNTDLTICASVDIPLGLTMAPGHVLGGNHGLRLNQALGYSIIMPGKPLMIYERAAALCASTGFSTEKTITCNNIRMMRSLIKNGAGIGILSWLDVMSDVEAQELVFVPLTDSVLRPMSLQLCTAAKRRLSKAAAMSVNYLERQMPKFGIPIGLTKIRPEV